MEQVASALDCAHEAEIIHRDVKPSNILLDGTDRATLTDFGLVMQAFDNTLGTAFGTPRYIAPEQALNSGSAVAQSDTYALAIILYEILTGQTPFDGSTPMEIALSHINDPVPPPHTLNDTIPEEAEVEILKALDKEPNNRHATASEFIAAVKRAYDPAGAHASTTELSSKTTALPDNLLSTKEAQTPKKRSPAIAIPAIALPAIRLQRETLMLALPIGLVVLLIVAILFVISRTTPTSSATSTPLLVSVPTSVSTSVPPTLETVGATDSAAVVVATNRCPSANRYAAPCRSAGTADLQRFGADTD